MNRNYLKTISLSLFIMLFIILSFSFRKADEAAVSFENNDKEFLPVLTAYSLYEGKIADLIPAKGVELYELSSHLFVDYAEKHRMIKLPAGTKMIFKGDGLPDFPDGTILVKTFYYYKDKRNLSDGKNIIETRLLIKKQSKWVVGTYKWNTQQTEASLITTGTDVNAAWIDADGKEKKIFFHIPSNAECSECHESNKADIPIGTKLRNMNFDVSRNGATINQIKHFQNIGWINSVDIAAIHSLPNWENPEYSLDKRARAYLDMNCAHCHNSKGSAADNKLVFEYEIPFDSTSIFLKKDKILKRMQSVEEDMRMPKIGTTVIDADGFELIKKYVNSLK